MNVKLFFHKFRKCTPITYEPTGEILTFYWETPWVHLQTFTVCSVCNKIKVLEETGTPFYPHQRSVDGTQFIGQFDYAKVPSIGRDKLTLSGKAQRLNEIDDELRELARNENKFLKDYIETESRLIHDYKL